MNGELQEKIERYRVLVEELEGDLSALSRECLVLREELIRIRRSYLFDICFLTLFFVSAMILADTTDAIGGIRGISGSISK